MDNNLLKAKALLTKYREGTCTEDEKAWVEDWYLKMGTEETDLSDEELTSDVHDLQSRLTEITTGKPARRNYPLIAIAATLLFVSGVGLYLFISRDIRPVVDQSAMIKDVPAGTDKATLTLSNGTTLDLKEAQNGTLATQQQTTIQKTADGRIIYNDEGSSGNSSSELSNTITTPRGGQFQVTLPDGTKVWLNAASSLKYPVSFNERRETGERGTRLVELSGEAYFEVAKDKAHPFIVKSGKQDVEVLGTHFNINSYQNEKDIKTTLEEGSVRVSAERSSKIIVPGQQVRLDANGSIAVIQADLETELAWKNGKLKFRDATIQQIMREVSRWYDIDIRYEGAVPADLFTGGISRKSNLSSVLRIFEASQINFQLQQNGTKNILVIKP